MGEDGRPEADPTTGKAASYFALQAAIGMTRHLGGRAATRELAERCGVGPGDRVLDVGCGAGATTAYLAEQFGCEVVGVDRDGEMLAWTRRRADGAAPGAVSATAGDARSLPFADGSFDAVVSESVTAFVEERGVAVEEYARVVRPGGYVALNEATWEADQPRSVVDEFVEVVGARPATADEWTALLDDAGLADVAVHEHDLSAFEEATNELRQYGPAGLARALYRLFAGLVTRPAVRGYARDVVASLREAGPLMERLDYALYVGRRPEAD